MILKCKVSTEGEAYLALIDPETKEHKKTASIAPGSEVSITLDDVDSPDGVGFGEVLETDTDPALTAGDNAERGNDIPVPADLAPGRIVTFCDREGLDNPAIVIATASSNQEGQAELSSPSAVHLTAFTVKGAGCYPALDVPQQDPGVEGITPGTWRWPERV